MSSGNRIRLLTSLSARLTLWFVAIFGLCLTVLITFFYLLVRDYLVRGADAAVIYELEEAVNAFREGGVDSLPAHLDSEAREYGEDRIFFRLIDRTGKVLYSTSLAAWGAVPATRTGGEPIRPGERIRETALVPGTGRFVRLIFVGLNEQLLLQSGIHLDNEARLQRMYAYALPLIGILVLVAATATGYLVMRRALRRVDELTDLAASISVSDLGKRVPVGNYNDELDHLATTFNHMLDRIQRLVIGMKQVTEDVAHEIRSPITCIRARAELALERGVRDEDADETASNTIEECDRLLSLVNTMLDISEADSGAVNLYRREIKVKELINTAIELFEPVAEEKHVSLLLSGDDIVIKGDLAKLQRVFSNLLDNAIKYSAAGGTVRIDCRASANERVVVSFADQGCGIGNEDLPLIFERFFRVNSSRGTPGNGLGLTISRSYVRAHGGEIKVESTPGTGTIFSVMLPKDSTGLGS